MILAVVLLLLLVLAAFLGLVVGEVLVALVIVLVVAVVAIPALRRGRGDQYPYTRSQFYSREARLRRAQLSISVAKLKPREPFFKLLRILAWILFGTQLTWALFQVIAAYVWREDEEILANVWWYYFATVGELVGILLVVGFHAWVKRHEPDTPKVQVGDSPLFVTDFTPGTKLATVNLLVTEGKPDKEDVHVELIPWGTVKNVSKVVAPLRGVIIARRLDDGRAAQLLLALEKLGVEKDTLKLLTPRLANGGNGNALPKQAGRFLGTVYTIPCRPEVYIKGDMGSWREYDWVKLVNDQFPEQTNDWTPILLAIDPYDPLTWEKSAEEVSTKRELFESRARVKQLTRRLRDYTQDDEVIDSFQRRPA